VTARRLRAAVTLFPPALVAAALAGASASAVAGAAAPARGVTAPWPQLAPLSQRFELGASQVLAVPLKVAQGHVAYQLVCRAQDMAAVRCDLLDATKKGGRSLLMHAGLRDRGLFHARDLEGACGAYPQFGRQRSFRLRGFELSLALFDEPGGTAGHPRLALQLDVQPDALATAPEAEAPEVPDPLSPGHSCQAPPPVADPFSCRKPEVEVTKPGCTQ